MQEKFGIKEPYSQQGSQEKSLARLRDVDLFDRCDEIRADKDYVPWGKRLFPTAYRLMFTHQEKIDIKLSEVMMASTTSEDDLLIRKILA